MEALNIKALQQRNVPESIAKITVWLSNKGRPDSNPQVSM